VDHERGAHHNDCAGAGHQYTSHEGQSAPVARAIVD
jgi:hypothetical protein